MIKIFKKIKNEIKNIIIWAFLTMITIIGISYFVNIPIDYDVNVTNRIGNYVINKRTLKIHVKNCSSVSRMSLKNKQNVTDSIDNLTEKGYVVCNRCKAGIKRKNETVANILESIEGIIFGIDDISYKTYEQYLDSVETMGEWYSTHIATYEGVYDDTATETAKEYYEIANKEKKGNILCYQCDLIDDCVGEYTKAGDDCVRFMLSCLNYTDNNFVYALTKLSKIPWSRINSRKLNKDKNQLQYALNNLGFEIYDIIPAKIDLNSDGYYEFEILPIDSGFKLKKGDILSRDGHIHIYLSDNENFGWGKVNNIYPQETNTYIDSSNYNIVCSGETFTRVYRYIGEN